MSGFSSIPTTTSSLGRQTYQLAFEISPIILNQGLAASVPGTMLPIVALTEAVNLVSDSLTLDPDLTLDNYFAHFKTQPGGTLLDFQIGEYPFANMQVAANAVIAQPLRVSVLMHTPVNKPNGYAQKLITFMALQAALQKHCLTGGSFTVATPAFIYTNCLLTYLRDVSGGDSKVPQNTWQFDFTQPLITQAAAAAAQSSLMSRISSNLPFSGQPATSGPAASISPASAPGTGAGAANLTGSNVGGYTFSGFS